MKIRKTSYSYFFEIVFEILIVYIWSNRYDKKEQMYLSIFKYIEVRGDIMNSMVSLIWLCKIINTFY